MGTVCRIYGDDQQQPHQFIRRVHTVDRIRISPMEQLFRNVEYRTASGINVIVPSQEISFRTPTVKIHLVLWLKEGKTFFDPAAHRTACLNLEDRKQCHQFFPDQTHFTARRIINMQPVPQRQKLRLDEILLPAVFIIHIISIRPGKHSLFDQQFHRRYPPFTEMSPLLLH